MRRIIAGLRAIKKPLALLFAIQTLLPSVVGVARRFGVPRAFAVLSMSVGYDTRSMLREEPLLR